MLMSPKNQNDVRPVMTKPTKWHMHPAKTQISLGIHPVWWVFAVRMKKAWALSYPLSAQRRLWSDWADAQADLSLCWAHIHFVGFVMLRLIWYNVSTPQILTDRHLRVLGDPSGNSYAIGDCADIKDYSLPCTAQVCTRTLTIRQISHAMRKPVYRVVRPGKTQTSLLGYR